MQHLYKNIPTGIKGITRKIDDVRNLSLLNAENKDFNLGEYSIDYIDEDGTITSISNTSLPNIWIKGLPNTCVDEATTPYFKFTSVSGHKLLLNCTWTVNGDTVDFSAHRVASYERFFSSNAQMPLTPWEFRSTIKSLDLSSVTWNNNTVFDAEWLTRPAYDDDYLIHMTCGYLGSNNMTYPLMDNIETLSFPHATYFGYGDFSRSQYITLDAPNVERIEGYNTNDNFLTFKNGDRAELINIPKCSYMGDPAKDNQTFLLLKMGCTINVHKSMETCNNGQPDADLLYAINSRGAIVNYI